MKITTAKIIQFIDQGSMVLSILMLTGGYVFIKILAVIAYPTSLWFLFIYWKKTIWALVQEKFFWLYIGLIIISISWSVDYGTSLYSTLKLMGTFIIGLSLAVRYNPRDQLRILTWTFAISILLSYFFGLVLPQQGIMWGGTLDGAWRGAFAHKNQLGRMMVIGTMVFFLSAIDSSKYRWLFWSGCAASFGLIILSQSKTALVAVLTLLALYPLYRTFRWSYNWIVIFFSIFIIAVGCSLILLVPNLGFFLEALGKDATLTGRLPLWEGSISSFMDRPWLGYGYDSFWSGISGESDKLLLLIDSDWAAPNSHNGFLEILLAFGLIGFVIATLVFLTIFFRSLACIRSTKSAFALWPLWYLTLLFLVSITESNTSPWSVYWAFNIAIAISTHRKIMYQHTPISRSIKKL